MTRSMFVVSRIYLILCSTMANSSFPCVLFFHFFTDSCSIPCSGKSSICLYTNKAYMSVARLPCLDRKRLIRTMKLNMYGIYAQYQQELALLSRVQLATYVGMSFLDMVHFAVEVFPSPRFFFSFLLPAFNLLLVIGHPSLYVRT